MVKFIIIIIIIIVILFFFGLEMLLKVFIFEVT